MCIPMEKISYVSKTREVNENFKLAFHMYLNEVFDYVGFLSYHSRCWQLLLTGSRGNRTLKQRVKNTYPLIDMGGREAASPVKSVPTPHRLFQLSGDSGILAELQLHNSLPSIPFQLLEGCLSLMQMRPALRLWLQKRGWGGQKGVQRSRGVVESWISCLKKKMHRAPLQQCFAAVKWGVLYFSEWRFYSVWAVVV